MTGQVLTDFVTFSLLFRYFLEVGSYDWAGPNGRVGGENYSPVRPYPLRDPILLYNFLLLQCHVHAACGNGVEFVTDEGYPLLVIQPNVSSIGRWLDLTRFNDVQDLVDGYAQFAREQASCPQA